MRKVQNSDWLQARVLALMTMLLIALFRPEIVAIHTSDHEVSEVAMSYLLSHSPTS